MNYLAKKIGIWFKDRKWANELFKEILNNIPKDAIIRCVNSISGMSIQLIDGTCVRFVPAEAHRANRFSEVYMQQGIDKMFYENVIACCVYPSNNVIVQVIRNANDILIGYKTADQYYWDGEKEDG